jgi:ABC-2 type transport system permease protein
MRTWLRIFFVGGAISFRALFSWIRPSIYIPTLLLGPTTQIVFFAYLGRTAHLKSDSWFVVGNAVQSASLAALFGMGFAIDGERWTQTLSAVLATPANRAALFARIRREIPFPRYCRVRATARIRRAPGGPSERAGEPLPGSLPPSCTCPSA